MKSRPYYTAYDYRYRQIHKEGLSWSMNAYSPELLQWIKDNKIPKTETILEIGCGEGRDSRFLSHIGYKTIGIDVSAEAIKYCKLKDNNQKVKYRKWDIVKHPYPNCCKWAFSVGVLHMLIEKRDRQKFLANIYKSLCTGGHLLLVNMGNGKRQFQSNKLDAFKLQKRKHQETGKEYMVSSTSCKIITSKEQKAEIRRSGLNIDKFRITKNKHYAECMTIYLTKTGARRPVSRPNGGALQQTRRTCLVNQNG